MDTSQKPFTLANEQQHGELVLDYILIVNTLVKEGLQVRGSEHSDNHNCKGLVGTDATVLTG